MRKGVICPCQLDAVSGEDGCHIYLFRAGFCLPAVISGCLCVRGGGFSLLFLWTLCLVHVPIRLRICPKADVPCCVCRNEPAPLAL